MSDGLYLWAALVKIIPLVGHCYLVYMSHNILSGCWCEPILSGHLGLISGYWCEPILSSHLGLISGYWCEPTLSGHLGLIFTLFTSNAWTVENFFLIDYIMKSKLSSLAVDAASHKTQLALVKNVVIQLHMFVDPISMFWMTSDTNHHNSIPFIYDSEQDRMVAVATKLGRNESNIFNSVNL